MAKYMLKANFTQSGTRDKMSGMKHSIAFATIVSLILWSGPVSVLYAEEATDTPIIVTPAEVIAPIVETLPPQTFTESTGTLPETLPPQETLPNPLPEIIPVPTEATSTDTQEGSNPQNASSSPYLQGAEGGQEAVPPTDTNASTTISTSTPEVIPEEILPPVDELLPPNATSTEVLPPQEELVVPPDEPQQEPEVTPPPQEQPLVEPVAVQISMEELAPEPEYVFSVKTGKRMDTKRLIKKNVLVGQKVVTTDVEETVTALPSISPDNATGVMNISGACSDKYYTVLLYKNAVDYERDRRAYVVNKAYPCEGGAFNYELSDLPPTLPSGTYYVLIGSQGDSGPWVPITGLTEVDITNKQTF